MFFLLLLILHVASYIYIFALYIYSLLLMLLVLEAYVKEKETGLRAVDKEMLVPASLWCINWIAIIPGWATF